MTVPYAAPGRTYWGRVGIAADRLANAVLGGVEDQTMSQTLGFSQIRREWMGLTFAPIVDLLNRAITGERHHCIRALYRDEDGRPIWPDRMPPGAPTTNPYP